MLGAPQRMLRAAAASPALLLARRTRCRSACAATTASSSEDARVVVITGASSGIGLELARQCALQPSLYKLVLVARREAALRQACAELREHTACSFVAADVTRRTEVERVLAEALAVHGRVDVWVNNAGAGSVSPALQLDERTVDDVLAVNLKSALWGMQVSIAHFLSRSPPCGHVLNVSSFLGKKPASSIRSIYSASKAALNSLSSTVRVDLAAAGHAGVHVTTILPGLVTTDFSAHAIGAPVGAAPTAVSSVVPSQSAAECAAVMLGAIAASRPGSGSLRVPAEVFTQGEAQKGAALAYAADVEGTEAAMAAAARGLRGA